MIESRLTEELHSAISATLLESSANFILEPLSPSRKRPVVPNVNLDQKLAIEIEAISNLDPTWWYGNFDIFQLVLLLLAIRVLSIV